MFAFSLTLYYGVSLGRRKSRGGSSITCLTEILKIY